MCMLLSAIITHAFQMRAIVYITFCYYTLFDFKWHIPTLIFTSSCFPRGKVYTTRHVYRIKLHLPAFSWYCFCISSHHVFVV